MAFAVSPSVTVREIDLTTVVPAVATTEGAIAGVFSWGPVGERRLVSSEDRLVYLYGKPTANNYETFFTAASFLAYGNQLWVSRAVDETAWNATANVAVVANTLVKSEDHYEEQTFTDTDLLYIAKYPGKLGNALKISVCDSADAYSNNYSGSAANTTVSVVFTAGSNQANLVVNSTDSLSVANTEVHAINNKLLVNDLVEVGNSTIGFQQLKVTAKGDVTAANSTAYRVNLTLNEKMGLISDITMTDLRRRWEHYGLFDRAPATTEFVEERNANTNSSNDEVHIAVIDRTGEIAGIPNTVLETWPNLSRATDARNESGETIYYKNVINQRSEWVWWANDRSLAASATSELVAPSTASTPLYLNFTAGTGDSDEKVVPLASLQNAADLFKNPEEIDVSILLQGKARGGFNEAQYANHLIDNIAEVRKDCVVCISPAKADVVNNLSPLDDVETFRNSLRSTSYGILDSGYKWMYDKYNDVFRWIPLNGDVGGTLVRTDLERDPWYSPAGFNRGIIKNIVKLAYNPDRADRDVLYRAGVNPVTNFRRDGIVLFGDKTLLARPSAFDRINVRRLFIVLEKAIATASKYTLFELNDEFTRAQFVAMVEPFLRTVKGRRGIYDFRVVCDETNNTPEIIDRNAFVGDIYIKPARSINFIRLNFVAVRTGVEFEEVVGRFGG